MKRFQLTIVFVLFSAITIGAGALAVNLTMTASAERSLLRLAETQSERDARFIATLVGQLLADDAPSEPVQPPLLGAPSELVPSPAFSSATLMVNAPTVLQALDVADLAIYDASGQRIWSSTLQGPIPATLSEQVLEKAVAGETDSAVLRDAAVLPSSPGSASDLVVTFVPLVGEVSGETVQVLGVSRPVPPGVTSLLAESQGTVLRTTVFSLSAIFLVLLAFVLSADLRIWRRHQAALAIEREQQKKLGQANRELSELDESRTRFISAISHEISNPLASLVSFLDMVLRNKTGNLDGKQIDHLTTARRNGQQMRRLVDDLAQASQSDVETLEIVCDEFEIRPMIDEVVDSMSHDLMSRQQSIETDIPEDTGVMEGDRARLIQVFSNLLSNASKYSPEGAHVRLAATTSDDFLTVEVTDEGIGISEEDQRHIFDMFWRAENPETQSVKGAGIGLVLAKQIVEGHGGHISVNSSPGKGTTMRFVVPLKASGPKAIRRQTAGTDIEDFTGDRWQRAA